MKSPIEFYNSEIVFFSAKLKSLKKKLAFSSSLRLMVFLTTGLCAYLFFNRIEILVPVLIIGVSSFVYLIYRHAILSEAKTLNSKLLAINKQEIEILNGDYFKFDEGVEYIDSSHYFSFDIDLFGPGSFFQYANRTASKGGRAAFVETLNSNDISEVKQKQETIKELAELPKWRQQFTAIASLVKAQHSPKSIVDWIHNYSSDFSKSIPLLLVVFPLVSLSLIVLVSFQIVAFKFLLLWFFIGMGIATFHLKNVNEVYKTASKAKDTFRQYHKLLDKIESVEFSATVLQEKQQTIQSNSLKASLIFKKFSKLLDALDQRNNIMVAVLLNSFLLWDLQQVFKIEKWITTYRETVESWVDVVSFFDAQNSLANFAFNHPEFVFPAIHKSNQIINAKELGHPLLKAQSRISNDLLVENQNFFIVTGANMAGKSTFLRTVSLAIVMANMGLPVCAKNFKYAPIKLITSMRTSDSLKDDESYFFSELKRLKFIVDQINMDDYFIILDEILKGTNSTDKAIGSKKFVEKLVTSKSSGIIATHDLSLCTIEAELQEIKNYYFDAIIDNDELSFDYKLKEGVCKNMNASFLLKKMEII